MKGVVVTQAITGQDRQDDADHVRASGGPLFIALVRYALRGCIHPRMGVGEASVGMRKGQHGIITCLADRRATQAAGQLAQSGQSQFAPQARLPGHVILYLCTFRDGYATKRS